jgi:MinD-like ATPase involved in chromosome partitioning or flagellar assembly
MDGVAVTLKMAKALTAAATAVSLPTSGTLAVAETTGRDIVERMIVTVVGPDRRADVALPVDAPIGELIPGLTEICARQTLDDVQTQLAWAVTPEGSDEPLADGASLTQCGVVEGDVLELRGVPVPVAQMMASRPAERMEPAPFEMGAAGGSPAFAGAVATLSQAPDMVPSAAGDLAPPLPPEVTAELAMEPAPAPVAEPEAAPSARQRTQASLPVRLPVSHRLSRASSALISRALPRPEAVVPLPAAEDGGAPPSPAELSRQRTATPWQRARRSWRSTDYRQQLQDLIAAPRLRRCATIAVLSPKGGVGKTTITALLGELLALVRRDRIVAVDTNPDYGSLGRTLTPEHSVFVDDLLEHLEHPALSVTALDICLGRAAHGLMVLPSPVDPERMARLDEEAYRRVIRRLQDLVGVVVLDCGTGLQDPATRAAIGAADQLVVVTDAEPATASLVAEACQLLEGGPPLTLVVNKMHRRSGRLDVDAFARHVPHARSLVVVPLAQTGAVRLTSGEFQWDDAPSGWQESVRELAAALVTQWSELGLAA